MVENIFCTLLCKNFAVTRRRLCFTIIIEIGVIIMWTILAFYLKYRNRIVTDDKYFEIFELTNIDIKKEELVYSPWNPDLKFIMDDVAKQMKITTVRVFNDSQLMIYHLYEKGRLDRTLAGVQFDDSLFGNKSLLKNVKVALRFPGELRQNDPQKTWDTHLLYSVLDLPGPRSLELRNTAPPRYYEEGFLNLQLAVTNAVIRYFNGNTTPITMQRLPYPKTEVHGTNATYYVVILFIHFSILLTLTILCKEIAKDDITKRTEMYRMAGAKNWEIWLTWFIKPLPLLLLATGLFMICCAYCFKFDRTFQGNLGVVFIFYTLFGIAVTSFCLFFCTCYHPKLEADKVGHEEKLGYSCSVAFFFAIFYLLSYVPFILLRAELYKTCLMGKLVFSLLPAVATSYGLYLIFLYEDHGVGVQWSNMWAAGTRNEDLTMGHVILMLLVDTILYGCIALCLQTLFQTSVINRMWCYPFKNLFCCLKTPIAVDILNPDSSGNKKDEFFEKEPDNIAVGLKAIYLRRWCQRFTISDITLNAYEDQVTVLLGHNSAEMETIIDLFAGILTPNGGDVVVEGYSMVRDRNKARKQISYCPFTNSAIAMLTVQENLHFFSALRGSDRGRIQMEVNKLLEVFLIKEAAQVKAHKVSQKYFRMVDLAIAFCGNPKVVLIIEPTTELEHVLRKAVHKIIKELKIGRTIIVYTNILYEVEEIADRVAIVKNGEIHSCASNSFLKKLHCTGYRLVARKSDECDPNEVTRMARRHIIDIQLERDTKSLLTYRLEETHSKYFQDLLADLEKHADSIGIKDFGITLTTLEDSLKKADSSTKNRKIRMTKNWYESGMIKCRDAQGNLITGDDRMVQESSMKFVLGYRSNSDPEPAYCFTGVEFHRALPNFTDREVIELVSNFTELFL